jgi:hypothetical protein
MIEDSVRINILIINRSCKKNKVADWQAITNPYKPAYRLLLIGIQ